MADNKDIAFKVNIDGVDRSINSLKELKQAKKDATDAFIKGDKEAAKTLAELKDKTEDLNDATRSLKSDGVEGLTGSFSLLREGFANFDAGKIKTAFSGIGAAMKAIPLILIIEGIKYLIDNFAELSQGTGVLGKVLRAIGDVISFVGDKFGELTDFLGLTNTALEKQGEALKKNAELAKESLDEQTQSYDRQIKIAKASGKNAIDLEIQKQLAILNTNKALVDQTLAYIRAGGVLKEEQTKLLKEQVNNINNARTEIAVIGLQQRTKELEETKKLEDDKRKEYEKTNKSKRGTDVAFVPPTEDDGAESEYLKNKDKAEADRLKKKQEDEDLDDQKRKEYLLSVQKKFEDDKIKETELAEKEKQRLKEETIKQDFQTTNDALSSISNVSQIFYTAKLANVKKGSVEEEKILKQQFETAKRFQIAQAVINGAQAVTAILSVPDFTLGIASAIRIASAITATGLTVAKIASTQFQSATPQGSVNVGGSNTGGGGVNTQAPNLNQNTQAPPTTTFTGNQNNNFNTVKAVVVETDNRNATNRIDKLTTEASF